MFARIENNTIVEYPLFEGQLQERFPGLRFPLDVYDTPVPDGYVKVFPRINNEFPNRYKIYDLGTPQLDAEGVWRESFIERDMTQEEHDRATTHYSTIERKRRNEFLKQSDTYVFPDRWETYSDQTKLEWKTYRQELRDITSQPEFPFVITWPISPVQFTIEPIIF